MTTPAAAPPPRPIVIAGPSGAGKGTLIELIQKHFDGPSANNNNNNNDANNNKVKKFGFSVSHTTRAPRPGEIDGVHYNFTTVETMTKEIAEGKFVEYAEVHGNYYGTSLSAIQSVQSQNQICILDIDIQGVRLLQQSSLLPSNYANYIFIAPPSMDELEKRLRGRGTEREQAILKRLENAKEEMEFGMQEGNFDEVLVNDDLEDTLDKLVGKLKEWYPDLLNDGNDDGEDDDREDGVTETENESKQQQPQQQQDDEEEEEEETKQSSFHPLENDDEEIPPPPIVDPLSFPQTPDGLSTFLSHIDGPCPLIEGYYSPTLPLTFKATNVKIGAGKKLDIPLPPIEQDGSKIEWNVTLVDEHEEHLDIQFGLVVVVNDGEEVVAREMGRILSPTPYISKKDKDKRGGGGGGVNNNVSDDATTTTSASGSSSEHHPTASTTTTSAKGKFTVSNSAPVTIIIKLDNSYSWFTPKKINYSFTVIPPVDTNMIERSLRAKSVMGKILEGREMALEKKEREVQRKTALARIQVEMEDKLKELQLKRENGRKNIEMIQEGTEKAEAKAKVAQKDIKEKLSLIKKEEKTIDEVTSAIIALEEECARLKKKWEELNIEKQCREEEKTKFEQHAEQKKQERMALQEEIASKKEEEKHIRKSLEELEREEQLVKDNLADLEKEKKAREEDERKYVEELKFLQSQMDACKLRIIEPK